MKIQPTNNSIYMMPSCQHSIFSAECRFALLKRIRPSNHYHNHLIQTGVAGGPEPNLGKTDAGRNQPRTGANTPPVILCDKELRSGVQPDSSILGISNNVASGCILLYNDKYCVNV